MEYITTRDVGFVDEINEATGELTGAGMHLNAGVTFWLFRTKHKWSLHPKAPEFDYYTIQIGGKHYQVLANMLDGKFKQIDPPQSLR